MHICILYKIVCLTSCISILGIPWQLWGWVGSTRCFYIFCYLLWSKLEKRNYFDFQLQIKTWEWKNERIKFSFFKSYNYFLYEIYFRCKKCPITQKGFFNHSASEKIRGTITSANILHWSCSKINSTYCCKSHNKAFKFYLPNEILSFLQHFFH